VSIRRAAVRREDRDRASVRWSKDSEAGVLPDTKILANMGKFISTTIN